MLFVTMIQLYHIDAKAEVTFEGFDSEGITHRPFTVTVDFEKMDYSIDDIVRNAQEKLSESLTYFVDTLGADNTDNGLPSGAQSG